MKIVKERFSKVLEVKKVSQAQLAEKLDVSKSLLSMMISGQRAINDEVGKRLTALFGLTTMKWATEFDECDTKLYE